MGPLGKYLIFLVKCGMLCRLDRKKIFLFTEVTYSRIVNLHLFKCKIRLRIGSPFCSAIFAYEF